MKAYAIEEYGKPLREMQFANPQPRGKEVLVKVRSCGLCHSDIHILDGYFDLGGGNRLTLDALGFKLPVIMGHETYGVIEDFGPQSGLTQADKGKPVIVFSWIGCGECELCKSGRDNECAAPQQIGIQAPGGHAEKIIVRDAKFLVNAEGIDPVAAGLYTCSGVTAYSALKKLGPEKDDWIGIVGVGGVGLMAVTIAKGIGFKKVVAIDIDDAKLQTAREHGADKAFNSRNANAVNTIKAETGGLRGMVDLVGSTESASLALGLLKPGGIHVTVGLFGGEIRIPLPILAFTQMQFRGSFTGTLDELKELIGFVRQGRIQPIPTRAVPITDVNAYITQLRSGKVTGRLVLTHN